MAANRCLPLTESTLAGRLKALGYATGIADDGHVCRLGGGLDQAA